MWLIVSDSWLFGMIIVVCWLELLMSILCTCVGESALVTKWAGLLLYGMMLIFLLCSLDMIMCMCELCGFM